LPDLLGFSQEELKRLAEVRDKKQTIFELYLATLELQLQMAHICMQSTLVHVMPNA